MAAHPHALLPAVAPRSDGAKPWPTAKPERSDAARQAAMVAPLGAAQKRSDGVQGPGAPPGQALSQAWVAGEG